MNRQRTVSWILACLIVTATFSALRLALMSNYNPVSHRSIEFFADMELSAMSTQERSPSRMENWTVHVPPSNPPSLPADAETIATSDQQPKGPSLWIYVQQFSEGMATWKISFAESLMVAKKLNATVVAPCIRRGRLRTCDDSTYRLDQVYDFRLLRQYHPHIVSFDDYQSMLAVENPVIISMCLQNPKAYPPPVELCGNISNWYKKRVNPLLDMALEQNNGTTVIHIKFYRRGGFHRTRVGDEGLADFEMTESILATYFAFERGQYEAVDKILGLMGISNTLDFDVIHWRGEARNMPYDDCVNKILQSREAMSSHTTVLLSSIRRQPDMQWYTSDNQSEAIESLDRLLNSGFHNLDQVLDKVQDMIPDKVVLAIWDQIITQKARRFATCTRCCQGARNPCVACNHLGNFAQTAVDWRNENNKTSDHCWPI